MTNADKFKSIFGLYATELWAKPEKDFLEWLNADVELFGISEQLNDLISRRAAIDEIKAVYEWHDMPTEERMIQHFKVLPSAQQWIPCSERLPGENESFYVLCCDIYGEIMIGNVFVCDDGHTPYSAESEHEYMYDCVAWMPLPEPWKGDTP